MRKMIVGVVAVGLLAAGGVAYALLSSSSAAAQDETPTTVAGDDLTTTTAVTDEGDGDDDAAPERPRRVDVVGEVLDGLVADGTISRAQADAINEAFDARRLELRGELRARAGERGFHHGRNGFFGFRSELRSLLEDGVIDADELATLPEDSVLRDADGPASSYLEDGEITEDELRQLMSELRELHRSSTDDIDAEESSLTF